MDIIKFFLYNVSLTNKSSYLLVTVFFCYKNETKILNEYYKGSNLLLVIEKYIIYIIQVYIKCIVYKYICYLSDGGRVVFHIIN